MQSLYAARMVDVAFDDPNLVSDAGLVPLIALTEQIGLPELVSDHLAIVDADNSAGADPHCKTMSVVAGMAAGVDSIKDIDRLRRTGLSPRFFTVMLVGVPAAVQGVSGVHRDCWA